MDEGLRQLERASRASPRDRDAAWAFVRALGRAGEERRRYLELARLAREGDLEAWQAIRPGRRPESARGDLARSHLVEATTSRVLECGDVVVLVDEEREVVALDATSLQLLWRRATVGTGRLVAVGPDLLEVEDGVLRLRSGRDGSVRHEVAMPVPARRWVASGTRVLATHGARSNEGRPRLTAIDVGEGFGRVLWERPGGTPFGLRAEKCQLQWEGSIETVSLESGERLGVSESPAQRLGIPVGEDEAGTLFSGTGQDESVLRLLERGRLFWELRRTTPGMAALAGERVVSARRSPSRRHEVAGLERATSRIAWAHGIEGADYTFAVARDAVYVVSSGEAIVVSNYDLAWGKQRWRTTLGRVAAGSGLALVPLERALLVIASGEARTVVARLA